MRSSVVPERALSQRHECGSRPAIKTICTLVHFLIKSYCAVPSTRVDELFSMFFWIKKTSRKCILSFRRHAVISANLRRVCGGRINFQWLFFSEVEMQSIISKCEKRSKRTTLRFCSKLTQIKQIKNGPPISHAWLTKKFTYVYKCSANEKCYFCFAECIELLKRKKRTVNLSLFNFFSLYFDVAMWVQRPWNCRNFQQTNKWTQYAHTQTMVKLI